MKLKYNRDSELEVVLFGVFKPGQLITIEDEKEAKRYLDSGYFDEVKKVIKEEKKIERVKKFKRKGKIK